MVVAMCSTHNCTGPSYAKYGAKFDDFRAMDMFETKNREARVHDTTRKEFKKRYSEVLQPTFMSVSNRGELKVRSQHWRREIRAELGKNWKSRMRQHGGEVCQAYDAPHRASRRFSLK